MMSTPPGRPHLLRALNDRAALDLLVEHGPLSRVQICELTGLSKPTASQLLGRLESAGLVRPVGTSSGGPGRNAVLYAVDGRVAHVAAVDITPGRVAVAIADIAGKLVHETEVRRSRGEKRSPADLVVGALATATGPIGLSRGDLASVVVGLPGAYDAAQDRVTLLDHLHGWSAPGSVATVRDALSPAVVVVENDVNLAAIAERHRGAGRRVGSFALLWVASGLGLAVDLEGVLHRGATGGAGEIGYMPVPATPPGPRPMDFHDLVGSAAVRRLARDFGVRGRSAADAVAAASTTADEASNGFLDEVATRLASGLATIVAVLDPELVVLTGDICRAGGERLTQRVQRHLHRLSKLRPSVAVSAVEGNPVLVGALELGLRGARDALFGSGGHAASQAAR